MFTTRTTKALRRTRLSLEALEDRTVPAVIDLGVANASSAVNNVIFKQASPAANVGADEFLRLNSAKKIEQGYNSAGAPQFDEVNQKTRLVRMQDLVPVTANGVTYRVLQLNVNEKRNAVLSLDELRIYVSNSSTVYGYNAATKQLGGLAPVFDLGSNFIMLDARLSGGNDLADMYVYIPQNILTAGGNTNPYVYLYSKFGVNFANNAGNERWGPAVGVVPLPPAPPGANNASLSGLIFRDYDNNGIKDGSDFGIEGQEVVLTGTTVDDESIEIHAFTNADGVYTFSNLKEGEYQLQEIQPFGYSSGINTIGSVDGVSTGLYDDVMGDLFYEIHLAAGKAGTGYNFAELIEDAPA